MKIIENKKTILWKDVKPGEIIQNNDSYYMRITDSGAFAEKHKDKMFAVELEYPFRLTWFASDWECEAYEAEAKLTSKVKT